MYLTVATYVADGRQTDFSIPFKYIKKEYVKAYSTELDSKGRTVGERVPLEFSWINDGMIRLSTKVPAGYKITIERDTYANEPLVDYQDAAILIESDLDLSALQSLHVAQEARDRNGYEIVEASTNVMIALDEVKEYAERAEDAAADSEVNLQDTEVALASAERAREITLEAKRNTLAAAEQTQENADLVVAARDEVVMAASNVASDAARAEEALEDTELAAQRVQGMVVEAEAARDVTVEAKGITEDARDDAQDAARRAAEHAAEAAAAAGVDFSLFVKQNDMATQLATKASLKHQHPASDVPELEQMLEAQIEETRGETDAALEQLLTSIRQEIAAGLAQMAELDHDHTIDEVIDLATALAGKAAVSHVHAIADVTGLQAALNLKAPLASPALTGSPTAPTQAAGNNTTRLATTAFVQTAAAGKMPKAQAAAGVGQITGFVIKNGSQYSMNPSKFYYIHSLPAGGTWFYYADYLGKMGFAAGGTIIYPDKTVQASVPGLCWRIA